MATRFTEALKNFKFPKEIRSDLIYCQRALRAHLKVHQMIVDQYLKDREYTTSRQSRLYELESEIYEINCEQQYLLLRVRRIVDEFFKSLHREDIGVDRVMMNDYISRQIVPLIQNKEYVCVPTLVRTRHTESQLLESFLILNKVNTEKSPPPGPVPAEIHHTSPESQPSLNAKQVSLLKPMSERVAPAILRQKSVAEIIISDDEKPAPPAPEPELPVSSKVKLSRLNLRQALSKAAAARNIAAQSVPVVAAPIAAPVVTEPKVIKVVERKNPPKPAKSEPSSSDDSMDVRMPSPQQLEMKTLPDDYNQESFLRLFNLYSQEQMQLLQQRRSKRKRRNVHNNEKADFHYGRIDHMLSPQPAASKKRKKEFLLSPRVNRNLKKKRSTDTDRSNSSSPDEKSLCSECMKRAGPVIQCKECPSSYHEKCHKEANMKVGQCPACCRKQNTAQQQKLEEEEKVKKNAAVLVEQVRDLELKLAFEEKRRKTLQADAKMYKVEMRNLIDIVQKIKTDTDK